MSGRALVRHGRARLAAVGLVLVLGGTAACAGGGLPSAGRPKAGTSIAPAPAARLSIEPVSGAQGVSPLAPVTVRAAAGRLEAVWLAALPGKGLPGSMSADHSRWRSATPLGYGRSYTVTAVATNADGRATWRVSTFTTLTPANLTMPYFGALEGGGTFGVGMPVTVHFDEPVPDRAAAERSLVVTSTPRMVGAWSWLGAQDVHWRPKVLPGHYWPPGTRVTVRAGVYGVNLGRGLYGQADRRVSFTIGRSHVAVIDDATHMMTVYLSGTVARYIPVSMGRGGSVTVNGRTIGLWTHSGPHVVQDKHLVKEMSSESYGLPKDSPLGYDEKIPLAVRISGSGEFVHSAPWSVDDQGVRNVSHGCVNISPANAEWFYRTFRYGDIVDVRSTARMLSVGDGLGDWTLSWDQWVEGSALHG